MAQNLGDLFIKTSNSDINIVRGQSVVNDNVTTSTDQTIKGTHSMFFLVT